MPGQPEGFDVLPAKLLDDEIDDVLQILVVSVSPHSGWRVRSGDDQAILVHIIQQRKIMTLPVAVRSASMQAQNECDLLTLFQIAWVIKEIGAARFHLDDISLIDHRGRRALPVRSEE